MKTTIGDWMAFKILIMVNLESLRLLEKPSEVIPEIGTMPN